MEDKTLYQRLGGYDAIAALVNVLLPRMMSDPQLARFWRDRSDDSRAREKQLLIDYLASASGGPVYYSGRGMNLSHRGLGISAADWQSFLGHLEVTLAELAVPASEAREVMAFIQSTRADVLV